MPDKALTSDKPFVQKWLLEIRFEPRPSMAVKGAEIADRWITDRWIGEGTQYEVNIQTSRYRVVDAQQHIAVTTGHNSATLEAEGMNDLPEFIKLAQRFAKDVREVVTNFRLERIGLRSWALQPGTPKEEAMTRIADRFFLMDDWDDANGRDALTDLMVTLEFMSSPQTQGRLHFGPYVAATNKKIFTFESHPAIVDYDEGYLFDCDFGLLSNDVGLLRPAELAKRLIDAYSISRSRVEKISKIILSGD